VLNLVVQEPFPGVRDGRKIDSGNTAKGRGEMEGRRKGEGEWAWSCYRLKEASQKCNDNCNGNCQSMKVSGIFVHTAC
jgi:hypothetical protein